MDTPFLFANIFGVVAQAGIYVTPKWEAYGRFEYGWWDVDGIPDVALITLGANYYIDGHDLKWTSDIGFGITEVGGVWQSSIAGWRSEVEDAEPQIVIRTQFQLLF